MRLAINGLGRIGRLLLRQLDAHPDIEVVAINDPAELRTLAHLVAHDSTHRKAPFPVHVEGTILRVGDRKIPTFRETQPESVPFGALGATLVLECSGAFTTRTEAARHLREGVQQVVISASCPDADATLVMGVNHDTYQPETHRIISAASAATQCLAPMAQIMDKAFGIRWGLATTVQSYANDQRILDLPHRDLRLARAASMSMIPSVSETPAEVGWVLPHLTGRLDGFVVRVPSPDVGLADLSLQLEREATLASVAEAFREACPAPHLDIIDEEIVSVDLIGHPASCVFDPFLTKIMAPRYVKVFAWFDNETSYAARLKDMARHILERSRP